MSLELIHGPPNSGRAGELRRRLTACLDREPVLVVPTFDDAYSFERELCEDGAVLGATVITFAGLSELIATAAGAPPAPRLTPAQRLGAVSLAAAETRSGLGPLRAPAGRPGFDRALERLLDELQGAGLEPGDVEANAATLEGSAYLADVAALYSAYATVRERLGRTDSHAVDRAAIGLLGGDHGFWDRPVFLYGFDDLTRNQIGLIEGLARAVEVTVTLVYESGGGPLEERGELLAALRDLGVDGEWETEPDPGNTPDAPPLFHLERTFGRGPAPDRVAPGDCVTVLRSAGERAEAEAIAGRVAQLLREGFDPAEIAIVVRDPARRGPLLASVLSAGGVGVALEADLPAGSTAVGGALLALLDSIHPEGTAADLLRFLRGPSATGRSKVDWLERKLRRERIRGAGEAIAACEERWEELPEDLRRVREAAGSPRRLAAEIARLAPAMAARCDSELEGRAGAAIARALADLGELDGLAPDAAGLRRAVADLSVRAWSGPVEGRVRIVDPGRARAGRFDCVFVASLQDGEFPRRDARSDPFLSDSQRQRLGLPPRRDTGSEERYLFHAALSLPRRRLCLAFRDSDENGGAEAPSPLLAEAFAAFDPAPAELVRDVASVVPPASSAPSEDALARALAAAGAAAPEPAETGAGATVAARLETRLRDARAVDAASAAPGPLAEEAVTESLAAVPAYGGTTLESFDQCSYRWFVSHELAPKRLDPDPDPLVQGGLMHAVLERLYGVGPGGERRPRPASLPAWLDRGRELVATMAAERGIGDHPAERAIRRRVEALLERFLREEAARETQFEPWLLEAEFGESEEAERPALEMGGWGLHGAIDRVDRDPAGRALVLDYKLAGAVTPFEKLEEEAKLQLQLYIAAAAELWGADPVAGFYHPLRGTSSRRARGFVLDEAADELAAYNPSRTDLIDRAGFERALTEARERADRIVRRMRAGDIRRDPGPRSGLRNHDVCPPYCDFAPICRRDRAPVDPGPEEDEER